MPGGVLPIFSFFSRHIPTSPGTHLAAVPLTGFTSFMPSLGFSCQDIGRVFSGHRGSVIALERVTFAVAPSSFVCIVGPSGCGKSTLLRLVAGLLDPRRAVLSLTAYPRAGNHARRLSFRTGLFPWLNVVENMAFGLEAQGVPRRRRLDMAGAFLDRVGLTGFALHFPHQLSGGMRQRVAIPQLFSAIPTSCSTHG